jgi:bacterioferritin
MLATHSDGGQIMKGSKVVIDALNSVLTKELTAINQYFLHARMLQNWGLEKLGKLEYAASIDEMKHADMVIKRILFLEGLPNLQKLDKLRIGTTLAEVLDADLEVEYSAVPHLKKCIQQAEKEADYASRDLFLTILKSEEHHVDWLETQRDLLKKVGVQNYMQSQMEPDQGAE